MGERYHLGKPPESGTSDSESERTEAHLRAHQLHHEATGILASKDFTSIHKVTLLTGLAIDTFSRLAEMENETSSVLADERMLRSYANFATQLSNSADPESQIDLEMLNEAVAEFVTISPISVALLIERIEIQHRLPSISTLAVKLWVLDRSENREALSSHFDKLHAAYFTPSAA